MARDGAALQDQALQAKNEQLVALLEAVVGLLNAGGNPGGLGADLGRLLRAGVAGAYSWLGQIDD